MRTPQIGSAQKPSADTQAELHARIASGDRAAAATLATIVLALVPRWLRRQFPRAPKDFVVDAVTDALVHDYLVRPARFDREAGALLSWPELAAKRNLQNRLEAENRLRAREHRYAEEHRIAIAFAGEDRQRYLTMSRLVREVCPPREREAAHLCLAGERRSEVIAGALGLTELSTEAQRHAVKRFKDRLKKSSVSLLKRESNVKSNFRPRRGSR